MASLAAAVSASAADDDVMTDTAPTPDFVNFPPFYTLQTNERTRTQQLLLWRNLVLNWVKVQGSASVKLDSFELFENKQIHRKLDRDGVAAVAGSLVESGHAQWEDNEHTRLRITWRTPHEWGALIYKWAQDSALNDSLFTLFELHSGDLTTNESFHGLEAGLMLQALESLQSNGRVQLYSSGVLDETGVKFLPSAA